MDPLSLAIVTAAVSSLAAKFAEGVVGEAAKDAYHKIKDLLGWADEIRLADIPVVTAKALSAAPEKMVEVMNLIENSGESTIAGQMVINAKNIGAINVFAPQTNTFN